MQFEIESLSLFLWLEKKLTENSYMLLLAKYF